MTADIVPIKAQHCPDCGGGPMTVFQPERPGASLLARCPACTRVVRAVAADGRPANLANVMRDGGRA